MNREHYLQLRQKDNSMEILYNAAKERGYNEDINIFSRKFITWAIPSAIKQNILNKIVDFYDKKFAIIITTFKDKIINIQ